MFPLWIRELTMLQPLLLLAIAMLVMRAMLPMLVLAIAMRAMLVLFVQLQAGSQLGSVSCAFASCGLPPVLAPTPCAFDCRCDPGYHTSPEYQQLYDCIYKGKIPANGLCNAPCKGGFPLCSLPNNHGREGSPFHSFERTNDKRRLCTIKANRHKRFPQRRTTPRRIFFALFGLCGFFFVCLPTALSARRRPRARRRTPALSHASRAVRLFVGVRLHVEEALRIRCWCQREHAGALLQAP